MNADTFLELLSGLQKYAKSYGIIFDIDHVWKKSPSGQKTA